MKPLKLIQRISLTLVLGCSAFAQMPDAPSAKKPANAWLSPFRDPTFYIGAGNHAASALFDVHSTKVCEANLTCVEAYKGHDSYGYIAPLIALEAGAQYGCSLMLSNHKRLRWGCLGISAATSFYHWKDGSTIYKINYKAQR